MKPGVPPQVLPFSAPGREDATEADCPGGRDPAGTSGTAGGENVATNRRKKHAAV